MAFSLVGFGAGLAESLTERIEEERKFSNLALQGRIERASVLKMQQEKEAKAIEEDLKGKLNTLKEFGVNDPELQKAYLSAPTALEALQKAKLSGLEVDPKALITVNKDKLFAGTPEEMIRAATRPTGTVKAATITPTEGGSMFAPSAGMQQQRFQQIASMRGLTPEDVGRAEAGFTPQRPEVAASINFEALKKEDKATWKQKLERYETVYADTVQRFGADSPEAIKAKNAVDSYRVTTNNLTEEQFDHAKKLSRANAIMFDKTMTNVTDQDRAWAKSYLDNYNAYKRQQEALGKPDEKIPAPGSLVSIARTAGANAVRNTYGTGVTRAQLAFVTNQDGSTSVQYSGDDPEMQKRIVRREQEGVVASLRMYMTQDGRVTDKKVEQALSAFGITLDENQKPILIEAAPMPPARERPAVPPRTPSAAATAVPLPSTPAPKPATTPEGFPPGSKIARNEFVAGKGFKVYNAEGKLIGYAQE